jgi:hypothetical protein
MTDINTQIMVEVLRIFGIATKELRRGSTSEFQIGYVSVTSKPHAEKFLRKLAGLADVENALKKLDRLTLEEARMALAEVLRFTHNVRDELKVVDGNVEIVRNKLMDVGDKVADMGGRVEDMGDKVVEVSDRVWHVRNKVEDIGDKMQFFDEKVQEVIDGTPSASTQLPKSSNIYTFRERANKSIGQGNKIDYSADGERHKRNQMFVTSTNPAVSLSSSLTFSQGTS